MRWARRRDPAVVTRLIASIVQRENLLPFDRTAMARIIEHSARLVADAERLTSHMQTVVNLLEEANHWAGEDGAEVVTAAHVQQAIDAQIYRSDRVRELLQDAVLRDTIMIDTAGAVVGQINGLAVLGMGSYAFRRASRITATVRMESRRSGGHRAGGGIERAAPLQGRADPLQLSACPLRRGRTALPGREPGLRAELRRR
ncbi:MAG: Lon-insertion domain-containing protein [Caldilineaceae bacterium]